MVSVTSSQNYGPDNLGGSPICLGPSSYCNLLYYKEEKLQPY